MPHVSSGVGTLGAAGDIAVGWMDVMEAVLCAWDAGVEPTVSSPGFPHFLL